MEHLQTFNEHQKRKFKSFQKEKQSEIDKKEEEERKKSWGNYGGRYGGGYGYGDYGSEYDDWYDQATSNVIIINPTKPVHTPVIGGTSSNTSKLSNNSVLILTQKDRLGGNLDAKKRAVYEEALLDLFPDLEIRKLPEACILVDDEDELHGISPDKDYDLLDGTRSNMVTMIANYGKEVSYGSYWFRTYKKYPIDVYVCPKEIHTMVSKNNLSRRKPYKLIGESESLYEIEDDKKERKGYPKLWFGLPFKMGLSGGQIISKTEARGGLHDYD